ncbi:RDD family protein [Streptosporangium sp. NBC_01639]|uniref:RDD family protein n=1 Tax=Streptosporangium sp. NBC_01639 TaxID=2975948 RepID=UPI00386AA31B|nr:RDD family protein [Streptosporangium sp. NBC_01639]
MTITPQIQATPTLAARRHRFSAFLIDSLIFYVMASPIYLLPAEEVEASGGSILADYLNPYAGDPNWPIEVAVTVLLAVYFWLQHALWGQTPGKRLCRLKVVSGATGEPPGLRHAGIRALVYPVLTSAPYLGVFLNVVDTLWIFGDPKRRCLHDVVAGTIVVDLEGPGRKGFGGPGFLLGLGAILALGVAVALVSVLMAR